MAHAVVGAIVSYEAGNSAAAGAAGAVSGELMAQLVMNQLYPGKQVSDLTETEKQTVSVLGTLAAGLAGGVTGGSAADGMAGAQAGKNSTENNALSSQDEKQRQDAKWSLPYIKDEKQKQQAEKLISDLNAKDKAFDAKLNAACEGLSSAACQGMRQELAAMAKSYDEQLDGQYIGTMGSVYKKGKDQVDVLMWQYATADAKAEREANVNRIAENWGVSQETAANLYDSMAIAHTTAAIGGAVYGMKGIKEPSASPAKPETTGKGSTQADVNQSKGIDNSAGKGTAGTGSKAGEYLEDFKPSPTPNELVQQQTGKGGQVTINTEHILNGEVKTYANGTKVGTGGHYLKDPNVKVDSLTGAADANGVTQGYISIRDPATGKWVQKKVETTFFPEQWSKRQTEAEIKSAFENSKPNPDNKEMWQGTSSSGLKMEGYYKKPDGTGATAWPVYKGVKK